MKRLSLTTTALYLAIASAAFADGNSFNITQTAVGTNGGTATFTQENGAGQVANVNQTGLNTITGDQEGNGAKFISTQSNPTSGAANTISYTGTNTSNTTINQGASYSTFTASGASGNAANVFVQGYPDATYATPKVLVTQAGYNNNASINSDIVGYTPIASSPANNINVVQLSDNANSGNQFTGAVTSGVATSLSVAQVGGNKANVLVSAGVQDM